MTNSKQEILKSFNRAASKYESYSFIQKIVEKKLLERLNFINDNFSNILDIGCGTGHGLQQLRKAYPKSNLTGLDIAMDMLKQAQMKKTAWLDKKIHYINADAESLPFKESQFDLIFSNLTLHWCDFTAAMKNCNRVLKPGGMILFTLPGPDTFQELRAASENVDTFSHINTFDDMHDYGDKLQVLGFENAVVDMEKIIFEYADFSQLLNDLKCTGVKNINPDRRKTLTPRTQFDKIGQAYPKKNQTYPLTFEIIFGHATCPLKKATKIPLTLSC